MEVVMTAEKIESDANCKACNCREDCLSDSRKKKWQVIKDMDGSCYTSKT